MAALTLPGSLLARLFHAKASAEGPAPGTQPPASGTGDAAFPALLEGLVGEQAAGQERNSGGHTKGKFTELERLIARTGRVRPPDKNATETDLVTVRSLDGKPAVPEVKQASQRAAVPVVPEQQIPGSGEPAEQAPSLPGLRIAERPTQEFHGLPAIVRATTPAAGGSRDTRGESKIQAPKVQLGTQPVANVGPAPPEHRAAAGPGVAVAEKAQRSANLKDEPATGHLHATATAARAHVSLDVANVMSEGTPAKNARPEPDHFVPSPPAALHAAAEQPEIEWAPNAMQLATHRPAAKQAAPPYTGASIPARAARQSTVTNPERHQQTGTAGNKPAPAPPAELELPVPAAPPVIPEKPHAPPDASPARSLAPNVATDGKPAASLRAAANEKVPAPPSASDELPAARHLDTWLKSSVPAGAPVANQSADPVARPSARSADNLAPGGAKVRTLSIASTDRGEVAFEVELRPTAQPTVTNEKVMPQGAPAPVKVVAPESAAIEAVTGPTAPAPREDVAQIAEAPAPGGDTDRPATGDRDRKQGTSERSPKPAPLVDSHSESAAALPEAKVSNWTQSGVSRQEGMPEPASTRDAAPARPDEPATARTDAKAEIQPASAHEIKLEVSGGDRRVEVRLSERGGEVRVAVRTPDSHLAGTLREGLPELTTRFAESGMRSEIWRPGGSLNGESRHAAETAPGNLAQDAESQSRGNGGEQQRDAQEQQRSFQEPKNDKDKGKDFAWLMSSLR